MKPDKITPNSLEFAQTFSDQRSKGKQAFRVCMRVFVVAAIVITLLFSVTVYNTGHFAITGWQSIKPWLACWRLGLFVSLIGAWPYWINHYSRWAHLDAGQQQVIINTRWRVAILLLLVELVLVQQGLTVLLS